MIIGLMTRNVAKAAFRIPLKQQFVLCRPYSAGDRGKKGEPPTEPYAGAYRNPLDLVKNGFRRHGNDGNTSTSADNIPRETDIVIIGGGALGMSAAYWLKQRHPEGYNVTLVERDPTVCVGLFL